MRIAIVGPGKMGRAVRDLARAAGHEVVAELDVGQVARAALCGADVAVEFTAPAAAPGNLTQLASWKVPTVCGSTGWYAQLPEVQAAVTRAGSALVYAPNFSLGVQVLLQLARETGRALAGRSEFDAWLLDVHHRAKLDAPSGTAAAMRAALRQADPAREYPVTSVRAGEVPGTHEIHIEGTGESLVVGHTAHDRTVFARGALVAAAWLTAKPRSGVFTFEQVLFGETGQGKGDR
jgi:4-hydroxy-tetrahydrodipicolinate reductase